MNRQQRRKLARVGKGVTKPGVHMKQHLPGERACEARQVYLAWRDNPDQRRKVLAQGMANPQANPCADHKTLSGAR